MRTKATIAFAALMVEVFSTCPLLAASSATAKAPPGTDNIAFGYGAGFGSSLWTSGFFFSFLPDASFDTYPLISFEKPAK